MYKFHFNPSKALVKNELKVLDRNQSGIKIVQK